MPGIVVSNSLQAEMFVVLVIAAIFCAVLLWHKNQLEPILGPGLEPEPHIARRFFVVTSMGCMVVFFWLHAWLIDILDSAGVLDRYRIQKDKRPEEDLRREATHDLLLVHTFGMPFIFYFGHGVFAGDAKHGLSWAAMPAWTELAWLLVVWHVAFDTWFYWMHRLFHTKHLYKHFHKKHHRFRTPTGIAAQFAHPVEDIIVNVGSTLIGPVLLPPSHVLIFFVWLACRLHETVDAHSGFDIPCSPWLLYPAEGARRHDWHHSHNAGMYGGFVFWDWAMGTDKKYNDWVAKQGQEAKDE